jgi:hypothetical protein
MKTSRKRRRQRAAACLALTTLLTLATASSGLSRPSGTLGVRTHDRHPYARSGVVFYAEGAASSAAREHATIALSQTQWQRPGCDARQAGRVPRSVAGQPIRTLAGYGIGRLGPLYFLAANPSRRNQIHFILLFDPGSYGDFTREGCEHRIGASRLLAEWLRDSPANRLVIIAGAGTADTADPLRPPELYRGIRQIYFPAIANREIAKQVLVCNLSNNGVPWSHRDVRKYFWLMEDAPECPHEYLRWHPGQNPERGYANHIVFWDRDPKSQKTMWLVGRDLKRRLIPDQTRANCLEAEGHPGPDKLPSFILDRLPDQFGKQASC